MRIGSPAALAVASSLIFMRNRVVAKDVALPSNLQEYLAAHPITVAHATSPKSQEASNGFRNQAKSNSPIYDSVRNRCPQNCDNAGSNPDGWTVYHDATSLARCNETMLLNFALYTPLDDPDNHISIRSCTADFGETSTKSDGSCLSSRVKQTKVEAPLQLAWTGSSDSAYTSDAVAAVQQMDRYLTRQAASCEETIAFALSGNVAVGLYAGSQIQSQNLVAPILQQFLAQVQANGIPENLFAQLCAQDNRSVRYSVGLIANSNADLASVQAAVHTWRDGNCVTGYDEAITWQNISLLAPSISTGSTRNATKATSALHPRTTTCSTVQVVSGDSCGSLAAECGITAAEFTQYNPSPTLCSTLTVGEYVCCSPGSLPNLAPSPDANGTCASYQVASGDSCSAIAAEYDLTVDQLESYNNDTWGWMGCSDLQVGNYICLSTGYPPMPAVVANAVCGPQVNGTTVAAPGTDLSTLNQCPLNACCDIWGQCGTTTEFCTSSNSSTGAPGTAAPGQNGCISNCGTDIIVGNPPDEFMSVGYFEGFDLSRPCLQMSVADIDTTNYSHIHLAFATLNSDFSVNVTSIAEQFELFVDLTGVKRIISFGGWEFSTSAASYEIFREAVQSANRATFVTNVVNFLDEYDLDGVDLDWEYPGEPDIPGIPPSTEEDVLNFLYFLDDLSASLNGTGKSLSVTAPASYWYLQNIPIQAISVVVDYIVYMTYDLHGQWDYGNAYSDPGCPAGNCLRSDVNLTETINALSMITKAGVPSNMVVVGVTSYGRSFQMTTPGCYTEMCTYTGPASGAFPGPCTQTAGYLANGEIDDIIAANSSGMLQYLDDSYSNILVYNETQWVSYMDDENKHSRALMYMGYNFGGVSDWAVDLQPATDGTGADGDSGGEIYVPPDIWSSPSPEVTCGAPCTVVLPPIPLASSVVVTWPSYVTSFLASASSSGASSGGISTVTSTYSFPPFTLGSVPVWPVTISEGDPSNGTWVPLQSVQPPPLVIELPPLQATFSPAPFTLDLGTTTTSASSGGASTSSSTTVVPIFYSTTQPITLQPQPTVSITFPPPFSTPTVTYSSGSPPAPTTTAGCPGCGDYNCLLFGCGGGCGLFSCDGGCGIFGCGGGCGLLGCSGACPLGFCSGGGGGGGGGGGDGPQETPEPEESCSVMQTASYCVEVISSFSTSGMSTYSTVTTVSVVWLEGMRGQ
jgi:chitinase